MREIINLQIGQCGINVGQQFLEKILEEHGIDKDGTDVGISDYQRQRADVFFAQIYDNTYRSRSVLADLEPGPIDSALGSSLGRLYDPDSFVVGSGSGNNNWAVGHFTRGAEVIHLVMDAIRRETQTCDHLEGFQLLQSMGGGTGSGLGSLCLQTIKDEFGDRLIQSFPVFPSPKVSDSVVEPYNTLLSLKSFLNSCDLCNVIQNQALFNICTSKLKIKSPTYSNFNSVIASVISNNTCGMRFPGDVNSNIRKLAINLVPFPRLHFLINSLAPLSPKSDKTRKFSPVEIFQQAFWHESFLSCEDPRHGRYLTASAIFRGKMKATEGQRLCFDLQDRRQGYFAYQLPSNMQSVHCRVPLPGQDLSMGSMANSSVIQKILDKYQQQFKSLYRRKAFVHWYTAEGADEMLFNEAIEQTTALINQYQAFQNDAVEQIQEEQEVVYGQK